MKKVISASLIAAAAAISAAPAFAADINVSVSIGQPGYYGRIEIGNYPQPLVINRQPIVILQAPVPVQQPLYLRVPPGHQKKWSKHCGRYNACGQPVYFVQDRWYNDVYAPRYRGEHERERDNRDRHDDDDGGHGKNKNKNKNKNKGHGHRD